MRPFSTAATAAFAAAIGFTSAAALAEPQTVTLDLPTMNCAICPVTVKKALDKLAGVSESAVSFESKQARVTYEDTETSVEALIEVTTNAGFPSTLAEEVAQ